MSRRTGALALSAVLLLCSCSQAQAAPRITFRTVNTSGIAAYKTPTDANGRYITGETKETDFFGTTSPSSAETLRPPETAASEKTEALSTEATAQYSSEPKSALPQSTPETTLLQSTPETTLPQSTSETILPQNTPETILPQSTPETAEQGELTSDNGGYSVIGENGILVVRLADGHYRGLMPCWGTYGLCESWAQSADKLAEKLPQVTAYQMTIPTSSEFYVPDEYSSGFTGSQLAKITHIADNLKNVKNVDVYSALEQHKDERIFSRTDHHWFPLGAYYAAQVFAADAGVTFADISEYKKVTKGGFVGSLYDYSKDIHLKNDPEDFDLYLSPNYDEITTYYYDSAFGGGYESNLFTSPDGGAYYCSFLGSDNRIARITTSCENGRTLVIFKESYGNALVPFLTSSFEKIYVCDIRYFDLNAVDFCKEVGATDLLFAVCTYTPAGSNGRYLSKIIEQ